jgi:hypothetical protein
MEKQKDAEPIADEQYELTPVALIDDSSAVLLPVEMADKKRGAKLQTRVIAGSSRVAEWPH